MLMDRGEKTPRRTPSGNYPECGNAFLPSNFNVGLRHRPGFLFRPSQLIGLFFGFFPLTDRYPPARPAAPGWPCDRATPLHLSIEYATGSHRQAGDPRMTSSPERLEGTVDPKLLEILVCPVTKGPLEFDSARQELISRAAKLAYPIRDGIPIMLPEEARKIE
jgi:uncharacterized protein YbaR (Trm112 family)